MEEIQEFIDEHREWAKQTFGNTPVTAPLIHLRKEVDELINGMKANDDDNVIEEFSDCFILLLHAADKYGMSAEDLLHHAKNKFVINKSRRWPAPNADGVSEHIK